jgi:cobalamin biosynthesis protein CobD/CbiB
MRFFAGRDRLLLGGGAAACAVCCAPPVLALVGIAGAGTVATLATLALAGLVFAVVVAAASVFAFVLRKRHRDQSGDLRHARRAVTLQAPVDPPATS